MPSRFGKAGLASRSYSYDIAVEGEKTDVGFQIFG